MSWYYYKKVKCKKCHEEYEQSIDTLSICAGQDSVCKFCGGELEHLNENIEKLEVYLEKNKSDFKNRKKRITMNCGAICNFDCKNCMVSKHK